MLCTDETVYRFQLLATGLGSLGGCRLLRLLLTAHLALAGLFLGGIAEKLVVITLLISSEEAKIRANFKNK
jgi:hypothetical protein